MTENTTPSRRPRGRILSALIGTAALLGAAAFAAPAANAATTETGETGWVRVAHLSPDTKSVDVRISAVAGGDSLFELNDVSYGAVSDYIDMDEGTYTIAMVPAGSSAETEPVISTSVAVEAGASVTVAAYGPTDDLDIRTFQDDLTSPTDGSSRVRLIQASTTTPTVDVSTSTGRAIARDAKTGSATNYAEVPAGEWQLELTGEDVTGTADLDLANGSVSTLFVLDTADGDLTIKSVLDSAAVGQVPVGGVETGGGALAPDFPMDTAALAELIR